MMAGDAVVRESEDIGSRHGVVDEFGRVFDRGGQGGRAIYKGLYIANERTIEVSLSGGQLIARIIGAAGVDGGEMRPLIPRSQTNFEGLGIAYQFIVDDKGMATDLVEVHISGPSRFPRQP